MLNHSTSSNFEIFLKGSLAIEVKLDRRIFFNADSESPPRDVGLKCFHDKLWVKNCFGHVIPRDIRHSHIDIRKKVKFLVRVSVWVMVRVRVLVSVRVRVRVEG